MVQDSMALLQEERDAAVGDLDLGLSGEDHAFFFSFSIRARWILDRAPWGQFSPPIHSSNQILLFIAYIINPLTPWVC